MNAGDVIFYAGSAVFICIMLAFLIEAITGR